MDQRHEWDTALTGAGEGLRVLLADDHAVVRKGIREFLELEGTIQVVAEANNGDLALRLVRELLPAVAVLDIQMPGQSGIEVARAIRAERLPVGILILTAFDDVPYVKAVLAAGANGYVLKSAEAHEIVAAVLAVHEGQAVLSPRVSQALAQDLARAHRGDLTRPIEALTEREHDVLRLAARGLTNKAIGVDLAISDRTVQAHLARIYDKLNAASRTEAVMRAVSLGLLPPNIDVEPNG